MLYESKNIRVLPDDTDAFGRLNWLAYNRYCEMGEVGLMGVLGFSPMHFYNRHKISFPRRAAAFEYFSQVSPENLIDLETDVKKVGRTSLTLLHTFYKKLKEDGERILAAKAEVTVVAFNDHLLYKVDLPEQLVEAIRRKCPNAFETES